MEGNVKEPIYENVQKDMENVTDIDERVINFLNVVMSAPRDIQKLTDDFLATIDKLKRGYISNIVRTKKVERKHSATEEYVDECVHEYNVFKRKDSYLDQVTPEDCQRVQDKLEKAKLELAMSVCQLQLSARELELSKEKLGRLSKRAEHFFISTLLNHPDRAWAQVYKNDAQRQKSELKRVSTIPAVLPKPALKVPNGNGTRDCKYCRKCASATCCRRCASATQIKSSKVRVRSPRQTRKCVKGSTLANKIPTKPESLEACVETFSSDEEEFPPPPPPLSPSECMFDTDVPFNFVSYRKTKRHSDRSTISDRSAVDEGIGDIDWNPTSSSQVTSECTSECGSELNDPLEKTRIHEIENEKLFINNNYEQTDNLRSEETGESDIQQQDIILEYACDPRDVAPETALTQGVENVQSAEITADDSLIEFLPTTEISFRLKSSPLEVNVLHCNEIESTDTPAAEKTTMPVEVLHSEFDRSETSVNDSTRVLCQNDDTSSKTVADDSTEQYTSLHENDGTSCTTITDNMISDRLKDLKTTDVEEGSMTSSAVSGRTEHTYEDRSFLQSNYNKQKKDRTKKKKKFQFLTKVFRGPWEGWDDE